MVKSSSMMLNCKNDQSPTSSKCTVTTVQTFIKINVCTVVTVFRNILEYDTVVPSFFFYLKILYVPTQQYITSRDEPSVRI